MLIRQRDGSVKAFDKTHVAAEVFLSRLDASLGRPPRRSAVTAALDNATPESRHAVEEMFSGTFMEDMEPRAEPVEDLSE